MWSILNIRFPKVLGVQDIGPNFGIPRKTNIGLITIPINGSHTLGEISMRSGLL